MGKLKTKKAAAKRFSYTANGKVKFKQAGMRHILGFRKRDNKRPKSKTAYLQKGDAQRMERMLPYGN